MYDTAELLHRQQSMTSNAVGYGDIHHRVFGDLPNYDGLETI